MHQYLTSLLVGILLLISSIPLIKIKNTELNEIYFSADLINIDALKEFHGGYISWSFSGEIVKTIRKNIDMHFGNSDGNITDYEAFLYFLYLESLIENPILKYGIIGTIEITSFDAMHGKGNQNLIDRGDVLGLINSIDSPEKITIKGKFEGIQKTEKNNVIRVEILAVPLLASIKNDKEIYFREYSDQFSVEVNIADSLLPIGTYTLESNAHPTIFRFVVGTHLRYSLRLKTNLTLSSSITTDQITKNDFDFYENPIILFCFVYISGTLSKIAFNNVVLRKYKYWIKERIGKWLIITGRIILYLIYFIPTIFTFYIGGIALMIISIMFPMLVYLIPTVLYRNRKIPHMTAIDDVYLISSSGILIAHATRRLKPDVDEDVLSSTLITIQDFVSTSFKDEKDVLVKYFEFGDKKVAVKKMGEFYLALVVTGELYEDLELRAEEVVKKINEKYGDIMKRWSGNVEEFRGVKEIMERIWKEDSTKE